MKVLKTIGSVSLYILAILSVIIMIVYGFYSYFVDSTTIGTNNIGDQIAVDVKAEADLTDSEKKELEERWFMEANLYSNEKDNGLFLYELNFNYFTSHKLLEADYRSTGIQLAYDTTVEGNFVENLVNSFYLYDTVDHISYAGYSNNGNSSVGTKLTRDEQFIIKIDNRPFTVQLTGTYTIENYFLFWDKTVELTYLNLFVDVLNAVKSNSAGTGDYYVTLNLSNYFTIREMDENGQYKADNVTDIIKNYAVLKFHYDDNGANYSNQSLFKTIASNSKYDKTDVEFWSGKMVYTLSAEDFQYRYDESQKGYYISIPNELKLLFSDMENYELNFSINLNSNYLKDKTVLGFDYNGFTDLNIETTTITGSSCSLKICDGAFTGTKLKTLKHGSGITFDGDFGIEFKEIVI